MEKNETWIVGRKYSNKYKEHIIVTITKEELQDNGITLWQGMRTNMGRKAQELLSLEEIRWYGIYDRKHWESAEQVIEKINNNTPDREPSQSNYAKDKYNDETKEEYRKA